MSKQLAQDGFTGKYVQFAGKRHRLVPPSALLEWLCKGGCGTTISKGEYCADCGDEGLCPVCKEPMNEASDTHLLCGSME